MRPEFKNYLDDLNKSYESGETDREEFYKRGKQFLPLSKDEEESILKLAPDLIVKLFCDILEDVPGVRRLVNCLQKQPADTFTSVQLFRTSCNSTHISLNLSVSAATNLLLPTRKYSKSKSNIKSP